MSTPRTSICIPTYNRANLLHICLSHALTAPDDVEIVVVDNASTDGTAKVISQFSDQDSRVRMVRNETNIGMIPNFNKAIAEARGEYLCVVCDDDLILPGHIEQKANILDRFSEIGLVYCPWHMIDANGASQGVPLGSGQLTYPYVGGRNEFDDLLQNNHIMMNSVLFRRSLWEELGGLDENPNIMPSPDWDMWLRYTYQRKTAYLPDACVSVRFHDDSNTTDGSRMGGFAKARVNIWRKWFVHREEPIVVNNHIWDRMFALWSQDLNYWFAGDQSRVQPYIEEFHAIRSANRDIHRERLFPAVQVENKKSQIEPKSVKNYLPITWRGNFLDFSGYARLARDMVRELDFRGISQSVEPEGSHPSFMSDLANQPDENERWMRLLNGKAKPGVSVYFGVPGWWDGTDAYGVNRINNPSAARHIGVAMFETDRLPYGWADACNGMDEVWVPSQFNVETFTKYGVERDKLHIIPFGIDTDLYSGVTPLKIDEKRGFTFLSVFQWSLRKGWDVLMRAFCTAFTSQDDVCLVIRAYPERIEDKSVREYVSQYLTTMGLDYATAPRIIVLDQFISETDIPALYAAADAFVLPTRGEGWGIPLMEAMASGLPVIATRWSAHLDFMNDKNSLLIKVDCLKKVAPGVTARNPFYGEDHLWAETSLSHTIELMRSVFDCRDEARAKGKRAQQDIRENWNIWRTGQWVIEQVERIQLARSTPAEFPIADSPMKGSAPTAIVWSSPLLDPSGYAEEARHFVFALNDCGQQISTQPIRWNSAEAILPEAQERLLLHLSSQKPGADYVRVCHVLPSYFQLDVNARLNIGRTMFETDRLPESWVERCNQMDKVWVPSEFNRATFTFAGVLPEKLAVIPGAIDEAPYRKSEKLTIPGAKGFNFISIFDWSLRKGWDVLIRAYVQEFNLNEDVALVIKTHSSLGYSIHQIVENVANFIQNELGVNPEEAPNIEFVDTTVPNHQMPAFYRGADCFVLPTRGEGWGRPFMEAMAAGLPVIGTNWSGNTAFMNSGNSMLIDYDLVTVSEAACREAVTFTGHQWAEPDNTHLRAFMRHAFEDRAVVRKLGQVAQEDILSRFSYAKVSALIVEELARCLAGEASASPHNSKIALKAA